MANIIEKYLQEMVRNQQETTKNIVKIVETTQTLMQKLNNNTGGGQGWLSNLLTSALGGGAGAYGVNKVAQLRDKIDLSRRSDELKEKKKNIQKEDANIDAKGKMSLLSSRGGKVKDFLAEYEKAKKESPILNRDDDKPNMEKPKKVGEDFISAATKGAEKSLKSKLTGGFIEKGLNKALSAAGLGGAAAGIVSKIVPALAVASAAVTVGKVALDIAGPGEGFSGSNMAARNKQLTDAGEQSMGTRSWLTYILAQLNPVNFGTTAAAYANANLNAFHINNKGIS